MPRPPVSGGLQAVEHLLGVDQSMCMQDLLGRARQAIQHLRQRKAPVCPRAYKPIVEERFVADGANLDRGDTPLRLALEVRGQIIEEALEILAEPFGEDVALQERRPAIVHHAMPVAGQQVQQVIEDPPGLPRLSDRGGDMDFRARDRGIRVEHDVVLFLCCSDPCCVKSDPEGVV